MDINKVSPSFVLNSEVNPDYTKSSFNAKIELPKNNNFDLVALTHCGIPRSFYNIDENVNTLIIRKNDEAIPHVFQIPIGNYTLENTGLILSQKLSLELGWDVEVVFNGFTHKWDFSIAGVGFSKIGFQFIRGTPHKLLGFPRHDSSVEFTNPIFSSPIVMNFEKTKYITVKSTIAHNEGNESADSQILARIPVHKTVGFNEIIEYNLIQIQDGCKGIHNNKQNSYFFSIHDDEDFDMRLNGRHWFATITMFQHNNTQNENKLVKEQLEEIDFTRKERAMKKAKQQPREDLMIDEEDFKKGDFEPEVIKESPNK